MSYEPHQWSSGDVISSSRLNHIEAGIANIAMGNYDLIAVASTSASSFSEWASDTLKRVTFYYGSIDDCINKLDEDYESIDGILIYGAEYSNITEQAIFNLTDFTACASDSAAPSNLSGHLIFTNTQYSAPSSFSVQGIDLNYITDTTNNTRDISVISAYTKTI